jgi:hypothetical protein
VRREEIENGEGVDKIRTWGNRQSEAREGKWGDQRYQCIDNERGSMTRMKVIMATRTTMNPKRGIQEGQKDG